MNDVFVSICVGLLASIGGGLLFFMKKLYERIEVLNEEVMSLKIEIVKLKKD